MFVNLSQQGLTGAEGAAKILERFEPSAEDLNLYGNSDFGFEGLQHLVKGMTESKVWRLRKLNLNMCGLRGMSPEASLEQVTQLIQLTPSLRELYLFYNDLQDLPAALIQAVVYHPTLEVLGLSYNDRLGCSHGLSTPCPINRLLSELYLAGSSSSLVLRTLWLDGIGMEADCCGPVLKRVLSLGSRGLHHLHLSGNPYLSPHARALIRLISDDNLSIQSSYINVPNDLEWEDGEGLTGSCRDTLELALEENRWLEKETHQAAVMLLKLSRIIFLGSPGPSCSSELDEPSPRTHLLDLPSELLQAVLSLVSPGALSNRQLLSVIRHAADRTTLLPTAPALETLVEQMALEGSVDLAARRRLLLQEKDEFLKETGCDRFDC